MSSTVVRSKPSSAEQPQRDRSPVRAHWFPAADPAASRRRKPCSPSRGDVNVLRYSSPSDEIVRGARSPMADGADRGPPTRAERGTATSWLDETCWSRRSPSTACAVSTEPRAPRAFDLDASLAAQPAGVDPPGAVRRAALPLRHPPAVLPEEPDAARRGRLAGPRTRPRAPPACTPGSPAADAAAATGPRWQRSPSSQMITRTERVHEHGPRCRWSSSSSSGWTRRSA